ncbi:hypothetical protein TRAPUB_6580 [Trametes pubescens]|uniref:F-box domain-containing protein n=1 Tax=Trametes pubescens TaxID=154538 RepID=A0A1M2V5K6_TRAPU|nr:hypothetical protein TRAPUB_6580 [Trametes pubescens]
MSICSGHSVVAVFQKVKPGPPHVIQAQKGDCTEEDRLVLQHFNTPALPFEVLEMILVQAWLSLPTSEPETRWAFFREMSLVNHQWRDIVLQVTRRHVAICLTSEDDLSAYGAIGQQSLKLRFPERSVEAAVATKGTATDAHSCDASSASPLREADATTSSTTDSVTPSHLMASIFQHSNIYLYIPHGTLYTLRSELPQDPKTLKRYLRDREYLPRLRAAVPDCRRLSFSTCTEFDRTFEPRALLRFAGLLPSLTHLDFALPLPRSLDLLDPNDLPILPVFPNVRYLRFAQYPRCYCLKDMTMGIGHSPALAVRCPSARLTSSFPGVEHLHIDTPHILKHITPLPALHTLTLEVPWYRAGQQSSIMAYNLAAAVNRGLLGGPPRAAIRRTVVLHSPGAEPVGLAIARVACEQHDIVLVRRPFFE